MKALLLSAIKDGAFSPGFTDDRMRQVWPAHTGIVPSSIAVDERGIFALLDREGKTLLVAATPYPWMLEGFDGESVSETKAGKTWYLLAMAPDHPHSVLLRRLLPFTAPSVLECRESFGTGDRIGGTAPATPGHIEALSGSGLTPVLAQQSVRENHKTGRTFERVMDDVTWSVFREGYRGVWGSDADHLKTLDDIEEAARAGFTMFTIDPSEKIDNTADADSDADLSRKLAALFPGSAGKEAFLTRYAGKYGASEHDVARSGVKYLAAVRHAVLAYRRLTELLGGSGFNFEISIDETSTATTGLDHRIIASELTRGGVNLFSLAPRFAGAFEKGIDYRGSIAEFRDSLAEHVRISREFGNYRLSLHSGSDKFSIYPVFGELTDGFFHVKTAGTSYLEAVKTAAATDMGLFRRILTLSVETFAENAASYQISADAASIPDPSFLDSYDALRLVSEDPDVRQVLHIAFGVVLRNMGEELRGTLSRNREVYRRFLVRHIGRHVSLLKGT